MHIGQASDIELIFKPAQNFLSQSRLTILLAYVKDETDQVLKEGRLEILSLVDLFKEALDIICVEALNFFSKLQLYHESWFQLGFITSLLFKRCLGVVGRREEFVTVGLHKKGWQKHDGTIEAAQVLHHVYHVVGISFMDMLLVRQINFNLGLREVKCFIITISYQSS